MVQVDGRALLILVLASVALDFYLFYQIELLSLHLAEATDIATRAVALYGECKNDHYAIMQTQSEPVSHKD